MSFRSMRAWFEKRRAATPTRNRKRKTWLTLDALEDRLAPATMLWIGPSGGNWNSSSNWANADSILPDQHVPNAGDTAKFDPTSTAVTSLLIPFVSSGTNNSATIDVAISVQGISIESAYTATITNGSSANTIALGSSGYNQGGGTFDTASASLSSAGAFHQVGGTFNAGTSTVTLNTASDINLTASSSFYNLTHSGSAGVTMQSNIVVGNKLTNSGGSFDLNGWNLTVSGGGSNFSNAGTLALYGGESITGLVQDVTQGSWRYHPLSALVNLKDFGSTDYYDLTIAGLLGAARPTAALHVAHDLAVNFFGVLDTNGQDTTVDHDLVVQGTFTGSSGIVNAKNVDIQGSLTAPSTTMNVSGTWQNANSIGFDANGGSVNFNGLGQKISGYNYFHNFTKTTSVADTLYFASTILDRTVISGTLTLQGTLVNLLKLRSLATGTQWTIDPQSTRIVSFVDVQDSDNINATAIVANESLDSGNNTNWHFTVAKIQIDGSGNMTVTDNDGLDNTLVISLNGSNLRIHDPNHVLQAGNGATQVDNQTVEVPLASIFGTIQVKLGGGNDSLTVDSVNGLITIPIQYDGGTGFDRLTVTDTGESTRTSSRINVGANPGKGQSVVKDGSTTQTVFFENLEPVTDNVAAATFTLSSVAGIASLLDASNAINYVQGVDNGPSYGRITVDAFEPIEFKNKTTLIIDAGAGDDTINLNNPSVPTGLTGITVSGQDPTASDTLIVNSWAGTDQLLSVTPTAAASGKVVDPFAGGFTPVTFDTIEHLTVVGQSADNDRIRQDGTSGDDTMVVTPGPSIDQGTVTGFQAGAGGFNFVPVDYIGFRYYQTFPTYPDGPGNDTTIINGTSADDTFLLRDSPAFAGSFQVQVNGSIPIFAYVGTGTVILRGLDGNDNFTTDLDPVSTLETDTLLRIEGGDSDASSDTLNYLATSGAATTIDLGLGKITQTPAANPVSFSGIDKLNETSSGSGSTLTIKGTAGPDGMSYTPTGTSAGTVTQSGQPIVTFAGVGSTFTLDAAGGSDTVTVNGTSGNDTGANDIDVVRGTTTTVQVGTFKTVSLPTANTEALVIAGGLGDDAINVSGSGGPASLTIDGGPPSASDTLSITTGTAATVAVTYGTDPSSGVVSDNVAGNVSFVNKEHLVLTGAGTTSLTVNGTNGNDAINQNGNLVTVNDGADVSFSAYQTLTLNGNSGDDAINVRSTTLSGVTTFNVNGNDPTASDSLVFNGTAAANSCTFTTLTASSATITGLGPTINVATMEHVVYNGQGGGDAMTLTTPSGNTVDYFTPGEDADSAHLNLRSSFGGELLAFDYVNVNGFSATLTFNGGLGLGDSLNVYGTGDDDLFNVTSGGSIRLGTPAPAPGGVPFKSVTINTTNVDRLDLLAGDGDDTFNIAGNHPFTGQLGGPGIIIEGGAPSASNVINYTGNSNAAVTVAPSTSTISQTGPTAGRVVYSGIERVNVVVSGSTSTLTVVGSDGHDAFAFTPTAKGAGSFTASGTGSTIYTAPLFTYAGVGGNISVTGGSDGFDEIGLIGTPGNDSMDANQTAAGTLVLALNSFSQTFSLTSIEGASIQGLAGDDLIRVGTIDSLETTTPGASLRFDVDGGPPNASDRLIVRDDGLGDLDIVRQGPDLRSGSVLIGAFNPVNYQNVERVDVTPLDPITGGTGTDKNGRVKIFHPDPFESNESRVFAGPLARVAESPTSPNIDPGAAFGNDETLANGDEDWYEFRPTITSTFQVKILFDKVPTLTNGRPGLPGDGDLNLDIYDANGGLLTSGVLDTDLKNKVAVFGASPTDPQYDRIFIRVRGATSSSINVYDFDNLANGGVTNLDILGPQVQDVRITGQPTYNLFRQKYANALQAPTPLVDSLTIKITDPPNRANGFAYGALDTVVAMTPGTYQLKGDSVGIIALDLIAGISVTNDAVTVGMSATATIVLTFAKPLPDDRYTFTIFDNLTDPPGNRLDGESNASEPNGSPSFPSGDGHSGGNFVARFTVDSLPEIATWGSSTVYADLNGDGIWNPAPQGDQTNRDAAFRFGTIYDYIFAGKFPGPNANGYDKLGAYGRVNGKYRFLLDLNGDGVPDTTIISNKQVSGMPFAGNWDSSDANDELGLFDGKTWYLDTNSDNKFDKAFSGNMRGFPIAGDFDGDGKTDLGTYQPDNNLFQFDLAANGLNGNADATIDLQDQVGAFGLAGVMERPVAADMNGDGITDIGLFMPSQLGLPSQVGQLGQGTAEWHFWVSNPDPEFGPPPGSIDALAHPFRPVQTGGNDLSFDFGNNFALPVVGNFDPPSNAKKNTAPTFDVLPDVSVLASQGPANVNLVARDKQGDDISYSARALDLAYALDQQLKLSLSKSYYTNSHKLKEKNLKGADGWYMILPSGDLYKWGGSLAKSKFIASLGASVYADPRLLYNAKPKTLPVKLTIAGSQLTIDPSGFLGTFVVEVTATDGALSTKTTFRVTFQ